MPPGSAMASSRAAMLTPSPWMSLVFDDHIAQIDADAELDALICRDSGIALAHRRAASPPRKRPPRRRSANSTNNPSPVVLTMRPLCSAIFGIDQLAAQRPEARQRAGLVLAHQPAVPRDIGRENRRQSALDPHFRHRASLVQLTLRRCPRPINRGSAGSPLAGIGTVCYISNIKLTKLRQRICRCFRNRGHGTKFRCQFPANHSKLAAHRPIRYRQASEIPFFFGAGALSQRPKKIFPAVREDERCRGAECGRSKATRRSGSGRASGGAGEARCSSRKMPCQMPSCSRPSVTGMVSCVWVSALLMWAGMSSGPSSLWR